ncbi:MAG TPA: S8 family serine peptidase, partial [Pyrinomonadaceae bacterium]
MLRLTGVLEAGDKRQPVIVDQTGLTQDVIVEQVARQIATGNVKDALKGRSIIKLEDAALFSRAGTPAELAKQLSDVITQATASKGQTILYINELTSVLAVPHIADQLSAAIANGQLTLIGGCNFVQYSESIERSAELAKLFQPINVESSIKTSTSAEDKKNSDDSEDYRGDNVSPDLREMIKQDPTGARRTDVILQVKNADDSNLRMLLANGTAQIASRVGDTNTLVVNMPLSTVSTLSTSGMINYISPDRATHATGFVEDATGTSQMRQQLNGLGSPYTLDGSGVGVAVVDSGIYSTHNGFKDTNGVSRIAAKVGFAVGPSGDDHYGHGTYVAGLASGNADYSNGAYRGVASSSKIVSVKVLNDSGQGQTSWLLNGLNWILQNKDQYNIRVVNISLSSDAVDSWTNDPVCRKVKDLVTSGIVVVASSGNTGKDSNGNKLYGMIGSPGVSPYAITVGATNTFSTVSHTDDVVATYSSRGPTRSAYTRPDGTKVYDNLIKPDLVAPGNKLISYRTDKALITSLNPSLWVNPTAQKNDSMMMLSGTSAAAPVVAGAAALLLEANPNLTPGLIKMLLQYSAQPIAGANMFEQGAGQLNVDGAVRLAK